MTAPLDIANLDVEFVLDTGSDYPRMIPFLRTEVAAQARGVSVSTIRSWIRGGWISPPREIDGEIGWPVHEVQDWIVPVPGGEE